MIRIRHNFNVNGIFVTSFSKLTVDVDCSLALKTQHVECQTLFNSIDSNVSALNFINNKEIDILNEILVKVCVKKSEK